MYLAKKVNNFSFWALVITTALTLLLAFSLDSLRESERHIVISVWLSFAALTVIACLLRFLFWLAYKYRVLNEKQKTKAP